MLKDDVLSFLRKHRLRLDTDAGQHFLVDQDTLDAIIIASDVNADDLVVEIGPGIGVLTKELLRRAGHVTAVEIDERFLPLMHDYCGDTQKLTLTHGNALQERMPKETYKVVANIPYHITSPLLHHVLIESEVRPLSITMLIQREVAENMAREGSDSILTVLVRLFGTAEVTHLVPPSAFVPPPKVDSAVIHIIPYREPLASPATVQKVLALAKHAMSQRRKMLRNSVGNLSHGSEAMAKAGIALDRRPQTLRIEEWLALQKAFDDFRA
jgi:16S rRNA (adenine1518-N6/adenine1519-N6)-dimethyltransferase